jgi:uncharacterized membrane protein YdjX (TVP38/TMEM64 family)
MEQAIADVLSISWLPMNSVVAVAAITFVAAAVLMALGVPGVIVPLSLTSGAMLDAEIAAAAVAAGGAVGSQALFLLARTAFRERARGRVGDRLHGIEQAFARRGAWYVLGLRLVGAPSLALTGACALLPIRHGTFALVSFAGFLPAAWLAASVGSAF